jgi:hypothetical protein
VVTAPPPPLLNLLRLYRDLSKNTFISTLL